MVPEFCACQRESDASATPPERDRRELPAATVRTVVAAIEGCEEFGGRVRGESDRLGAACRADVTVLADGAEWIGNPAADHRPQATGARMRAGRSARLAGGKVGLGRWLADVLAAAGEGCRADPRIGLAGYMAKHPTRLTCADRLAEGLRAGVPAAGQWRGRSSKTSTCG